MELWLSDTRPLPASPKSDEENFEYIQHTNRRICPLRVLRKGRCPKGGGGPGAPGKGGGVGQFYGSGILTVSDSNWTSTGSLWGEDTPMPTLPSGKSKRVSVNVFTRVPLTNRLSWFPLQLTV